MPNTTFTAPVISGSGRGKKIGIPTLNLAIENVVLDLESGLYVCLVQLDTQTVELPALLHYGARPTFNDSLSCEVYVIDTRITEPVTQVSVRIVGKIREVQKFTDAETLVDQIKRDIITARTFFHD